MTYTGLKSQSCHACLNHHNTVKSYYLPYITVLTDVGGSCGHDQTHLIPLGTWELGKFCPGKASLNNHLSTPNVSWNGKLVALEQHLVQGSTWVCLCVHVHTPARAELLLCEIFQKLAAAAAALGKLKSWNLWINPSTKLSVSNSVPVSNTLGRVNLCRTSYSWHFWYSDLGGCSNSRCLNHWFLLEVLHHRWHQICSCKYSGIFHVHAQKYSIRS